MASSPHSELMQVISGDGAFNSAEVDSFVQQQGLMGKGQDYQVVAIMGPQSSGKSTLLNHVVSARERVQRSNRSTGSGLESLRTTCCLHRCAVRHLVRDDGRNGRAQSDNQGGRGSLGATQIPPPRSLPACTQPCSATAPMLTRRMHVACWCPGHLDGPIQQDL